MLPSHSAAVRLRKGGGIDRTVPSHFPDGAFDEIGEAAAAFNTGAADSIKNALNTIGTTLATTGEASVGGLFLSTVFDELRRTFHELDYSHSLDS